MPARAPKTQTGDGAARSPRRNAVQVAREWCEALQTGVYASPADLARTLGLSRARVSQVLALLRLPPDVVESLAALDGTDGAWTVSEHALRSLVNLRPEDQARRVQELLATWLRARTGVGHSSSAG